MVCGFCNAAGGFSFVIRMVALCTCIRKGALVALSALCIVTHCVYYYLVWCFC